MYGQAAATMELFYATYEQNLMAFPGHMVWGGWVKDFDKNALQTMQKLLDKDLEALRIAVLSFRFK